jgi:DNA (cytosine-5)-methyltransferase 1
VFVVASARDDINPTEILFEFEGVRRDTPQSRQQGQEIAGTVTARFGNSRNNQEELAPVVGALDTECGGKKMNHQTVASGHIVAARMVSFGEYSIDGTASAMKARDYKDATDLVAQPMAVRRLTPVECERLQGFPDNYSNIPWRKGAESPDGIRYKALGNSWAVPVVAWIGQRIQNQIK